MRILITEGSGYVARFLAKQLRDRHKAVVFDLVEREPPVEYVEGHLCVFDEAQPAWSDVDAVIDVAAIPWDSGEVRKIMKVNVMGTFNVLEAAAMHSFEKAVSASPIDPRQRPEKEGYWDGVLIDATRRFRWWRTEIRGSDRAIKASPRSIH